MEQFDIEDSTIKEHEAKAPLFLQLQEHGLIQFVFGLAIVFLTGLLTIAFSLAPPHVFGVLFLPFQLVGLALAVVGCVQLCRFCCCQRKAATDAYIHQLEHS